MATKKSPAKKTATKGATKAPAKKTVNKTVKKAPVKKVVKEVQPSNIYNTNVSILLAMAVEALILLLGYLIIINA